MGGLIDTAVRRSCNFERNITASISTVVRTERKRLRLHNKMHVYSRFCDLELNDAQRSALFRFGDTPHDEDILKERCKFHAM